MGESALFDFSKIADQYDGWYDTREGELTDRLEKRAVRSLLVGMGEKGALLEVGSGTGWWSAWFSQRGFRVTGVDISWEMVAVARKKKIPAASFLSEDAHRLSFLDHQFDAACAITTLEFTREPESVIREMVRCTRPGGQLLLGILNSASTANRARRKVSGSPFEWARFFSIKDLRDRLSPFGQVKIIPCVFPFSMKLPLPLACLADGMLALSGRGTGAFLAVKVSL